MGAVVPKVGLEVDVGDAGDVVGLGFAGATQKYCVNEFPSTIVRSQVPVGMNAMFSTESVVPLEKVMFVKSPGYW